MYRFTTQPWRHQLEAFEFALHKPGVLLAMGMGTGKSKVTIDLLVNRNARRTLILCPKSVMEVWPGEFTKHTDSPFIVTVPTEGTVADRSKQVRRALDDATDRHCPSVVVVNYESAWRPYMNDTLLRAKFDHVILDECHRVKSAGGRASWFCSTLGKKTPWRVGLTGTPMPHSPLDVYAQYRFLDPRIFGTSNARFKARYSVTGGFNGKQVVGFINQDELQRKFYSIAYRVTEDVLDLPEAIHAFRYADLNPKTARLYRDLSEEFYAEVEAGEITVANALTKIIRLQQITSGFLVTDDGAIVDYGEEKLTLLGDIVEDIDPAEPLVVFVRFHYDLDKVKALLAKTGRSCAELSGRMNQYGEWKAGKYQAIVAQIQSGSVGIDFTRARYQLYYSVDHNLGNFQQSQRRILRPGQTRVVTYYYLAMKDTIDTRVYRALRKKTDVIMSVLNREEEQIDLFQKAS